MNTVVENKEDTVVEPAASPIVSSDDLYERKLAQVVRILEVKPVPGSDNLEAVKVLGWWCCVRKAQGYAVGHKCIYFCIDSILDENENTKFLEGKPLRTRKMCGQISQGLVAPLNWILPYVEAPTEFDPDTLVEGQDLTDIMRVQQWLSPDEEAGRGIVQSGASGRRQPRDDGRRMALLPGSAIPKTKQSRIQEHPSMIQELTGRHIVVTVKYDGCSVTYAVVNGVSAMYSRNVDITELTEEKVFRHYHEVARKDRRIFDDIAALGRNLGIQGEITGPSINGGRTGTKDIKFHVFDIWDVDTAQFLPWEEVKEICKKCKLATVPLVYSGIAPQEWLSADALLSLAGEQRYDADDGRKLLAEGLVVKTEGASRISFKVIANSYLTKHNC